MSEPRRSTRARAREEAATAPPETPADTPSKSLSKSLKRKRASIVPSKDGAGLATGAETPQQAPKHHLPVRLAEGQALPTLPAPQSLDLSPHDYQDIQQSGVLSASLQRSRAVWISGVNFRLFHAFFTPPKKVADRTEEDKQNIQRQKEIVRNFPLVGEAQLVIEPHTFPIRLYGPREVARQLPKKQTTYGQWPTHAQQSPYQYNSPSTAPYQTPPQPQPPPRPAQPKPPPPKVPQPAPQTNQTPAPDPVIHMLAQRAGQDPELKAVMKIVAAGQASKEQLEFFQGHINELTNLLQKQKEAAARAPPPPPPAPKPVIAPPPPQPLPPAQPQQQPVAKPFSPAVPQAHQPQMAPATPHNAPFPTAHNHGYNHHQQYQQPQYAPASQAPRSSYRPLVFEFVEGNGDKFYFPSYSFMEWLNASQGAKFSFLITKMKPKPAPEPPVKANTPSTPAPKVAPPPSTGPSPAATPIVPMTLNGTQPFNQNNAMTPGPLQMVTPTPPVTPYVPPPRIEDFDEKKDMKDIEFYQPLTVHILSSSTDVLQSLPRAVRPPDVVDKYMNTIFDTNRRAEETYLAFRLPKEGVEVDGEERRIKNGDATPTVSTPIVEILKGGMGAPLDGKKSAGRPRKSLV
jgi:hypothetical protein